MYKSLVTVTNVVEPTVDKPGTAQITINSEYRIVTKEYGVVHPAHLIDKSEYTKIFKYGNRIVKLYKLPSSNPFIVPAKLLEDEKKVNGRFFRENKNSYFLCNISYEMNIVESSNIGNLYEIIEWIYENPDTRGVILSGDLALEDIGIIHNNLQMRVQALKNFNINGGQLNKMEKPIIDFCESKAYGFFIRNYIKGKASQYHGKSIVIGEFYDTIKSDSYTLNKLFDEHNITLYKDEADIPGSVPSNLKDIDTLIKVFNADKIATFFIIIYLKVIFINGIDSDGMFSIINKDIDKRENLINRNSYVYEAYGLNPIEHKYESSDKLNGIIFYPKIIYLNQNIFKKGATSIKSSLTPAEMCVHETGHNLAKYFNHGDNGKYYPETGLMSSNPNMVYPTLLDSLGIINDPINLANLIRL